MPVLPPVFRRMAGRIAVALVALVLAACSAEVADPYAGGYRPRPAPICPAEYRPVCATRGGEPQTFANACEAQASGFRILGPGECRLRPPPPRPDEGRACTREYAPVCAARGGERQTFANACEARRSGYDILGRGECRMIRPDRDRDDRGRDRDRDRDDRRVCTSDYNPVCAQQGRDRRTFGNACTAEVAGYRIVRRGECPMR